MDNSLTSIIISVTAGEVLDGKTVEEILVAMDTCTRSDHRSLKSTIKRVHEVFGYSREFMQIALLIAFKRRNHDKSQAGGTGDGEILQFLEILVAVLELGDYDDLISAVLPLVPQYGSWKDLRHLGVLLAQDVILRKEDATENDLPEICKQVCHLFASQMAADLKGLQEEGPEKDDFVPSNACKYVPHSGRSNGKRGATRDDDTDADDIGGDSTKAKKRKAVAGKAFVPRKSTTSTAATTTTALVLGDGVGGGGLSSSVSKTKEVSAASTEVDVEGTEGKRSLTNQANSLLARAISKELYPEEGGLPHRRSAAFRKARASLNRRLAERGHLIEPVLCAKEPQKINFYKANKGALTMVRKAIRRYGFATEWAAAMAKSAKAVNDIDSMFAAVLDQNEEKDEEIKFFPFRVAKAVQSIRARRDELLEKAKEYMEKQKNTLQMKDIEGDDTAMATEVADEGIRTVPVGCIVDTGGCNDHTERSALVLAGFLLAQAQEQDAMIIDGRRVTIRSSAVGGGGIVGEDALEETHTYVDWATLVPADTPRGDPVMRLRQSGIALLGYAAGASESPHCDILFICTTFQAYEADPEEVLATISSLQAGRASEGADELPVCLRSFRVHRVRPSFEGSSSDTITFTPRHERTALPEEVSADILFIVDFTASMGPYMQEVKSQLVEIIRSIQFGAGLRRVRVALVGYRDWNDHGRVVVVDFHDSADLEGILDTILTEHASGGDDVPEDLLSAVVAANGSISWLSFIRLAVVITDAEAHGMANGGRGDKFPSGRCPDQAAPYPDLRQAFTTLAQEKFVDTFMARLGRGGGSENTEALVASVYKRTGGFGVVRMSEGATALKQQVTACLGQAIVATIGAVSTEGLQSADGSTLSSLTASLLASFRESLQGFDDADADMTTKEGGKEKKAPETDFQRLARELAMADLCPVRIALGVSPSGSGSGDSLTLGAADTLLNAGVTVADLEEHGYPDKIIKVFRKAVAKRLAAL